ncbi:hypothetical protein [Burkholderia vietnamiensis]|uniref:hypothetical protein n=1 Tax=Burkholderia vietnamiensis TaxID=60552 RepID=UPI001E489131|nr:hypothetical protein [Burkholderia vietnamiensis]
MNIKAGLAVLTLLLAVGLLAACSLARLLNALAPRYTFSLFADIPYGPGERHVLDVYVPAYSTQREQPFQCKVNRDSTAKRTRIPRHREQTERSDAGPLPFYSDCGFAVNRLRVLRSDSPASVMR